MHILQKENMNLKKNMKKSQKNMILEERKITNGKKPLINLVS